MTGPDRYEVRADAIEQMRATAKKNLSDVVDSGTYGDVGERSTFNRRFEEEMRQLLGVGHALTMNSGTAALQAALASLGVGAGDEVIVDPLLKYGAVSCIHLGGLPVFADVDPNSLTMAADSVRRLVGPRTKAIVATATFGHPNDIRALRSAAPGVPVVEDCAQALLAIGPTGLAGTDADIGCFSFQSTKHLSTGEGGLLVTSNDQLAYRAATYRTHGRADDIPRTDTSLGHMFRMPEASAAIGLAMLDLLPLIRECHQNRWNALSDAAGCEWLTPQSSHYTAESAYWVWCAIAEPGSSLKMLIEELARSGTDLSVGYCGGMPIHLRPLIQQNLSIQQHRLPVPGDCPVAEEIIHRMVHVRTLESPTERFIRTCELLATLD